MPGAAAHITLSGCTVQTTRVFQGDKILHGVKDSSTGDDKDPLGQQALSLWEI